MHFIAFIVFVCKDGPILICLCRLYTVLKGRKQNCFCQKGFNFVYACADWFRLDIEPSSATVTFVHT